MRSKHLGDADCMAKALKNEECQGNGTTACAPASTGAIRLVRLRCPSSGHAGGHAAPPQVGGAAQELVPQAAGLPTVPGLLVGEVQYHGSHAAYREVAHQALRRLRASEGEVIVQGWVMEEGVDTTGDSVAGGGEVSRGRGPKPPLKSLGVHRRLSHR